MLGCTNNSIKKKKIRKIKLNNKFNLQGCLNELITFGECREKERDTIGTKRGPSDNGQCLAGIDVLENGFVETREVLVAFFQH